MLRGEEANEVIEAIAPTLEVCIRSYMPCAPTTEHHSQEFVSNVGSKM